MPDIHLMNFADENYAAIQKKSSLRARNIGKVDYIHEFSPNDIDDDFKSKHENIFRHQRGCGLWPW